MSKWAFFPDTEEQQALLNTPVEALYPGLVRDGQDTGVLIQAIHDLLLAGHETKAVALLEKAKADYSTEQLINQVKLIILFAVSILMVDLAKEKRFLEFCKSQKVAPDIEFLG